MNNLNLNLNKSKIIKFFNEKKFQKISKLSKLISSKFINDYDILKIVIASEINLNNFQKAESVILNVIDQNKDPEIFYLWGNILKSQRKYEKAIEAFSKAIKENPKYSQAYNNLANTEKILGRKIDAIKNYKKAIEVNSENAEANYNLANLFRQSKQYKLAISYYQNSLKINPYLVQSMNNIGLIYLATGEFDKANKCFVEAIKNDEFYSEAYKNYASLNTLSKEDDQLKKLIKLTEVEKNERVINKETFYALSKYFTDIGEIKKGFMYLQKANTIRVKETNYSLKSDKEHLGKIKNYFETNNFTLNNFDKTNFIPIFILGMPRSGTTLIEQIISNHSKVYGAGELNILPGIIENLDWANENDPKKIIKNVRESYLENIKKISNRNYFTDKLTDNFKYIGFIINSLPEAKIIHLERNPMAVCWSNYKSHFDKAGMGFSLKQQTMAQYYMYYLDLMNFWKKKYPNNIIHINYENFVNDEKTNIKNLFQNLGLNWEDHLFDFEKNSKSVETASFKQVRSKIYKNSSEKWKIYKDYLKPMMEVLQDGKIKFE